MAVVDYGVLVKKNGVVQNLNGGLFMDMKKAVGFTIKSVPYSYTYEGEKKTYDQLIEDDFFAYLGDEELLFCIYKRTIALVKNKKELSYLGFSYDDDSKKVKHYKLENATITIKLLDDSKYLAHIQYKGDNYQVLFGYGVDNNIRTIRKLMKDKDYGYNKKFSKIVSNFINL